MSGHRGGISLGSAFHVSILLCLIAACSPAARYILVTDRNDVNFADGDRFYLCLTAEDAKRVSGMLRLRTRSDVAKYGQTRTGTAEPLEPVFYHLIKSDFPSAKAELDRRKDLVPPYLRLLLTADLSYETNDRTISTSELIDMYQAAYENQDCDLNRDIIKMRIRQVRYGR